MIEPLRIIRTTPQLTAFIPLTVPRAEIRAVMGPALDELRAAVAAQGVAAAGPWFTHHLRNPGEIFDFEICLPIAASVTPALRMRTGEWPAMTVAQTTYHGGYEGLPAAWGAFMKEIEARGSETVEGLWECYLIGPDAEADPAAWRTQLNKPLRDA